jgi:hypothetical protein
MQRIWDKPVTLALGEPKEWVVIRTTQAAALALVEQWPQDEGPALKRACIVCANVLTGKRTPEEARQAFVEAAIEAEVPMLD